MAVFGTRPEGVAARTLKLAGIEEENIFNLADELLTSKAVHDQMAMASNPYGDENASKRIVEAILFHFGFGSERPIDFGKEK